MIASDLYVARRNGYGTKPGGYLLINDHPSQWIDVWVDTDQPVGVIYRDYAGRDVDKVVQPPYGGSKNRVKLWSPPRSWTLYVADTTGIINHPPALAKVPDMIIYTLGRFRYPLNIADADGDSLNITLVESPAWLNLTQRCFEGIPAYADTGLSRVIYSVTDSHAESVADTFMLTVLLNHPPVLDAVEDATVKATKRFEQMVTAFDPDGDSLTYSLILTPPWLSLHPVSGRLSGTPALEDIDVYEVVLKAGDGKGAFDTTAFTITVVSSTDSLIATYAKPVIDGNILIGDSDWREDWLIAVDSDSDSHWRPQVGIDNELFGLLATWDADSFYLGIDYRINDVNNTLMVYLDVGKPGGVTNFNSNQGYFGAYPKNFRFRQADAIDFFLAAYRLEAPSLFQIVGNQSLDLSGKIHSARGLNANDAEVAIAWNDLYGLGAGLILPGAVIQCVALVAGGDNWGAGDALPDNPDVDGNQGPDSLILLIRSEPDKDADGIPDPTTFIWTHANATRPLVRTHQLLQNYPNPFNCRTEIIFCLPEQEYVLLAVYDLRGREIARLADGWMTMGMYRVFWDAPKVASGIYFYRLQAGSYISVRRMLLLK